MSEISIYSFSREEFIPDLLISSIRNWKLFWEVMVCLLYDHSQLVIYFLSIPCILTFPEALKTLSY